MSLPLVVSHPGPRELPPRESASDMMGVYTCTLVLLLDVDESIQIPEGDGGGEILGFVE